MSQCDADSNSSFTVSFFFILLIILCHLFQILIHIADCPCHGTQYHDSNIDDNYPNGDQYGLNHEMMMQKVVEFDLQYWFGYINKSYTDKMISVFNSTLSMLSRQKLIIRQFDAKLPSEVGLAIQR